ncbi:MAG: RNA polymerase sigma factor RpoD/SigA [Treponema sp.]|jgi:RNA polymerase primary sigma factor|nr:RNA polymerase sigma factor RpoD/SigA [Treponema sp.]
MAKKSKNNDKDDILESYYKQIKAIPLLTFEQELSLSKRIQVEGDKAALHQLVNANLRLVLKVAHMYNLPDANFLDIVQEGNLGLIHAAEKYDYQKNVRFCTYASWWIRQYIGRYLSNKYRIVRLPHRKEAILRKIQRTYHTLSQTLMHQPSTEDLAAELGISVKDIDFVVNMTSGPLPLETEYREDETNMMMQIHEDYTYSPERNLLRKISHDDTLRFLNRLKNREKWVLIYRYQLNGGESHTLREIGDIMDLSPETIRQIEMRALQKIRSQADELKDCIYTEAM